MAGLVWDKVGERDYETGLDRGVLYLPDGSAIPWNGLTSVIEHFDKESSPVYYDGRKISELVILGDFSATMKAITYPDEFGAFESLGLPGKHGIFYGDQKPKMFGLCYRVQVGNDLEGEAAGHKIHIIFNVTAVPKDKTYATLREDPSLVEFEWDIAAVPEELDGFRPTAHIILDSRNIDPWLFEELEAILYGSTTSQASLIPMQDLVVYIAEWYRIKIIDNGDGTWTAISRRDGQITVSPEDLITIFGANAVFLDDVTYQISDTWELADIPGIKIIYEGNGIWSATGPDNLVSVDVNGDFEILNANAIFVNPDEYEVSDTPS